MSNTISIPEAEQWLAEHLKIFSAHIPDAVQHDLEGTGPITTATFADFFKRNREEADVPERRLLWCLSLPGDSVFMLGNIVVGEAVAQPMITVGTNLKKLMAGKTGWASFQDYRHSAKGPNVSGIVERMRGYLEHITKAQSGVPEAAPTPKAKAEPKAAALAADRDHESRGSIEVIAQASGKQDGHVYMTIPMCKVSRSAYEQIVVILRGQHLVPGPLE